MFVPAENWTIPSSAEWRRWEKYRFIWRMLLMLLVQQITETHSRDGEVFSFHKRCYWRDRQEVRKYGGRQRAGQRSPSGREPDVAVMWPVLLPVYSWHVVTEWTFIQSHSPEHLAPISLNTPPALSQKIFSTKSHFLDFSWAFICSSLSSSV